MLRNVFCNITSICFVTHPKWCRQTIGPISLLCLVLIDQNMFTIIFYLCWPLTPMKVIIIIFTSHQLFCWPNMVVVAHSFPHLSLMTFDLKEDHYHLNLASVILLTIFGCHRTYTLLTLTPLRSSSFSACISGSFDQNYYGTGSHSTCIV